MDEFLRLQEVRRLYPRVLLLYVIYMYIYLYI